MKTGCIVQARSTSTRLPGKVLKLIDFKENKTILELVINRLQKSNEIDQIIIATTTNDDDDPIVTVAKKMGVEYFRGSEKDVLSRYFYAATENNLDNVIRVTSDCPFIDPDVIDELTVLFRSDNYEYASNCIRRTYPHGLDCEIFKYDVLKWMHENTKDAFYREHVTSYITSHYSCFNIVSLEADEDFSYLRITVDAKQDYILACVLQDFLRDMGDPQSYKAIVKCFSEHPYLNDINSDIIQKKQYNSIDEEIKDAVRMLRLQELYRAADKLKG